MKNLIFVILLGILLPGCNNSTGNAAKNGNATNDAPDPAIALKFINDYVDNCNKNGQSLSVREWTKRQPNASEKFKFDLERLIDEAYKDDPELGLDFDPVFDAQDYPEEGFELESLDKATGYLIVKGKKWTDFRLTMKMKKVNDKWLVDGCGVINIPEDKRMKR